MSATGSRACLHTGDFGFKFSKPRQLVVGTHNETLSVAAMCVNNPDRSPVGINR
jgi:hypothetical protein